MNHADVLARVEVRYDGLAEQTCCLSCGGAVERAGARPGETCLDLGSGRGADVLRLAERVGPAGRVYGVDTAAAMIAKAQRTAAKLGVTNVEFVRAAFERLPLESGSVDLVVSNCAVNHASDKDAVWREVHRVLKPGGRFVVSDIYSLEDVPERHRNDPQAVAECWAGAVRRDVYLATLAAAGLSDLTVLEESAPYDKGAIRVASFTLSGRKPGGRCCSV